MRKCARVSVGALDRHDRSERGLRTLHHQDVGSLDCCSGSRSIVGATRFATWPSQIDACARVLVHITSAFTSGVSKKVLEDRGGVLAVLVPVRDHRWQGTRRGQ